MPIEKQLKYFLEHHGLPSDTSNQQQDDSDYLSDVNSGDGYKSLRNKGKIDSFTMTLQINADGAKYFQTSKYSFWPLMAMVNEASCKVRRKFVILLAIWIGKNKPLRNTFMDGSIANLKRLERDGFFITENCTRFEFLLSQSTPSLDLVLPTRPNTMEKAAVICPSPWPTHIKRTWQHSSLGEKNGSYQ